MTDWITDEELLHRAKAVKIPATHRKIERWRKDGILQRSVQRHVSGYRGSVSFCPPESLDQLIALHRLHQKERRLDELRFLLWLECRSVNRPKLRRSVGTTLQKFGAKMRSQIEAEKSAARKEESDRDLVSAVAAERIAGKLAAKSRSPLVRFMKRNLRRRKSDVLSALMVVVQIMIGVPPVFGDAIEELGETTPEKSLFSGAGLDPAAQAGPGGLPPWIPDGAASIPDVLDVAQKIGIANVSRLAQILEEASDEELDRARDSVRFLTEDMPIFVRGYGVLFGKKVLGLGLFRFFDRIRTTEKMFLIPLMIMLHRRFGTQWLTTFAAEVRKFRYQAEALNALAQVFPQYKNYFSVDMAQKLTALPKKQQAKILKDVGLYLKEHHPEVFQEPT